MLHKYRKVVPIEAEQFDGSDEMISRYGIVDLAKVIESKEETTYVIPTKEGSMELKKVIIFQLALMANIGRLRRVSLNELIRGATNEKN